MKKITIKNNSGEVIGVNTLNDSDVELFVNNLNIKSPYGKPEQKIIIEAEKEISHPEQLEEKNELGEIIKPYQPAWTEIIPAVIETIPAEFSYEIEDITEQYNFEQKKIGLINKGNSFLQSCQNCLSIIGAYNDDRGLTVEQITQMATSFAQIESTLNRRMPKTSKQLIANINPDGILVTEELKNLLLDELKEY